MFGSRLNERSEAKKREDQRFMQALKAISTLQARDGHISMEASDLKEEIESLNVIAERMVKNSR